MVIGLVKPESTIQNSEAKKIYGKVWVEGNIVMEGYDEITKDNWKGIQIENMDGAGEFLPQIQMPNKRFDMPSLHNVDGN